MPSQASWQHKFLILQRREPLNVALVRKSNNLVRKLDALGFTLAKKITKFAFNSSKEGITWVSNKKKMGIMDLASLRKCNRFCLYICKKSNISVLLQKIMIQGLVLTEQVANFADICAKRATGIGHVLMQKMIAFCSAMM